jgi:5-oxoprolinase (ATP-hydrolysing)
MNRLQVAIDRGGTFTDVVARTSDGHISTMKLLSEDLDKYQDAPTEAIRRLLKQVRICLDDNRYCSLIVTCTILE